MASAFDVASTVLTRHKADTKDATKKLKKLKGEELKRHKALLEQTEKQNESIDKQVGRLKKLAIGVAGVTTAVFALKKGFEVYSKDAQLRAAAAGADIERLRQATEGLVKEQDLLAFSAAALNTKFKLTNEQMAEVSRFAVTLQKQGNDLDEVWQALTKSIVEGNAEALKPFGVIIEGASGKVETINKVLAEAAKQNKEFAGSADLAGNDMRRAGVRIENAFEKIQIALGKIAAALLPVIEGIAILAEGIATLDQSVVATVTSLQNANAGGAAGAGPAPGVSATDRRAALIAARRNIIERQIARRGSGGRSGGPRLLELLGVLDIPAAAGEATELLKQAFDARADAIRGAAGSEGQGFLDFFAPSPTVIDSATEKIGELSAAVRSYGEQIGFTSEQLAEHNALLQQQQAESIRSSTAFGIFETGATAAFQSVVAGNVALQESFDKALQAALNEASKFLWAKSLQWAAQSLAALGLGNFGSAAKFAGAAALAATGAVAIGRAGASFNPPAGGGAAGAAARTGGGFAGGGNFAQTRNRTDRVIIIGQPLDDRRTQAQRLRARLDVLNPTNRGPVDFS